MTMLLNDLSLAIDLDWTAYCLGEGGLMSFSKLSVRIFKWSYELRLGLVLPSPRRTLTLVGKKIKSMLKLLA